MKSLTAVALSGILFGLTDHTTGTGTGPVPDETAADATFAAASTPGTIALPAAPTRPPTNPASSAIGRPPPEISNEALTTVVRRVCGTCHNDQLRTANLSLQHFDVAAAPQMPQTTEKMILKLRAGMMPPPGIPRPGGDTLLALVETLEALIDEAAARNPNPGGRPFQRLNRREYERVIHDLLGLQVDAGEWLPLDMYLANFDNMAAAQAMSATLLTSYLNAASDISRRAVGHWSAPPLSHTYRIPEYVSQHRWDHVEATPYGTRGGMAVEHHFPADGDYVLELGFFGGGEQARFQDIDISINGERVALLHYGGLVMDDRRYGGTMRTDPLFIRAGQHRVSVAFIRRAEGPYEDLIRPHAGGHAGRSDYGTTGLPHLKSLTLVGPYNSTGVSESDSRRRIFTCRPTSAAEERPCAEEIVSRLATEAYRRPLQPQDLADLMNFYDTGAQKGGFEIGVRNALMAILASPYFVFRFEEKPPGVRAGEVFRLNDVDLASRLSFFLWGTLPDHELLALANGGKLSDPDVLEAQTLRLLADPRSEALGERFAAQWLRLQDMDKVRPDVFWFPDFTQQLADDMRRETELFFNDLVREDRSVLEIFGADYTFVNERLARHYGIPGISGDEFRRVPYPDHVQRRGVLGHGSTLLLTSMGNRTSPVLRGKWVMEVLLGTPPPPPPPGVPDLEETVGSKDGRLLTTRERMEIHRANPICNACHQFMDPIGLALDNFGVTGQWRIRENGMPLDTRGTFYDGTQIANPADLTGVLLKRPIPLVRNFTVNLLAYALGRQVEYYDQPTVRSIARAAAANDYRISSFILGVVESDAFQTRWATDPGVVAQDPQEGPGKF